MWTRAGVPDAETPALAMCRMPVPGLPDGWDDSSQHEDPVDGVVLGAVIPNFKQTTMIEFVKHHVRPGSTVHTDGLKGFEDLQGAGVKHVRRPQPLRSALRKGAASVVPLADRAIGQPAAVADRHLPRSQ